jgi:hypothetical protein
LGFVWNLDFLKLLASSPRLTALHPAPPTRRAALPVAVEECLAALPHDAHPMGTLLTGLAALSTCHPEQNPALAGQHVYKSREVQDKQIVRLIGKVPTLAAAAYHRLSGRKPTPPNQRLGYAEVGVGGVLNSAFMLAQPEHQYVLFINYVALLLRLILIINTKTHPPLTPPPTTHPTPELPLHARRGRARGLPAEPAPRARARRPLPPPRGARAQLLDLGRAPPRLLGRRRLHRCHGARG